MALLHVNFFSDVLGMSTSMDVILPEQTTGQIGMEGKGADKPYPTLYLLHGMSDDHTIWQRRTSIERYVSDMGLAVVMPTTHLGWYTDMAQGARWFTFVSQEVPDKCRSFFRNMSTRREDTFAAGLSMGGYGALKLGLRCPERFGAVASLSGALDAVARAQRDSSPLWRQVFGDPAQVPGSENDLFALAEQLKASSHPLPKLYLWCGTEDTLYPENVRMREHLNALGYDLTYEESPGDHQWRYWDEKIQSILRWLPIEAPSQTSD